MKLQFKKAWKTLFEKETSNIADSSSGNIVSLSSINLNETFMFDFATDYLGGFDDSVPMNEDDDSEPEKKKQRIEVSPKSVLDELETMPTPFSLNNLDDKIFMLKSKVEIISEDYIKREVKAVIERLNNRKQYSKHRKFFDQFQNTTEEKIDILLNKYDLVMKGADIFISEFPDEAIKIMKDYTKKVKDICDKKPVFYVIAENKDFKEKYKKRDPILLVQSPFGFYFQILGAWDEEMLLLNEL